MRSLRRMQRPIKARFGNFPTNQLPAAATRANYSPDICQCYLWCHCKHHMSFIKLYSRLFTPLGLQVFLCLVWRAEQHSQPDSSSLATHKMVGWRILYWPGPGREPGMFSNWFIDCEDRKQQSDIYCRGGDKARISSITVLCVHVLFSQPQPPASLSPTR